MVLGVPLDLITAAIDKITQKQLRSAAILEKKNLAAKRKQIKTEKNVKAEPTELVATNTVAEAENNENNQVIELPNIIEGLFLFFSGSFQGVSHSCCLKIVKSLKGFFRFLKNS